MKGRETGVNIVKMHCTKSQRTKKRMRKTELEHRGQESATSSKGNSTYNTELTSLQFPFPGALAASFLVPLVVLYPPFIPASTMPQTAGNLLLFSRHVVWLANSLRGRNQMWRSSQGFSCSSESWPWRFKCFGFLLEPCLKEACFLLLCFS